MYVIVINYVAKYCISLWMVLLYKLYMERQPSTFLSAINCINCKSNVSQDKAYFAIIHN